MRTWCSIDYGFFAVVDSLSAMARFIVKAFPLASRGTNLHLPVIIIASMWRLPPCSPSSQLASVPLSTLGFLSPFSYFWGTNFRPVSDSLSTMVASRELFEITVRSYRKISHRELIPKEKPLEFDVKIFIEEDLPDDPQILSIAETLRADVPVALQVALDRLKTSEYNTRDTCIDNISKFGKVELSVLFCDDDFIQKLNKDWRDVDKATDVLSMSQHIPELDDDILSLGDIVISFDTAARQAQERGYALLDEVRILMLHGLLHLLGFDHEISSEAEAEMEEEEELILRNLGWKGKGLIQGAHSKIDESHLTEIPYELSKKVKMEGRSGFCEAKLSYIICDADDILFNSNSQINMRMVEALREAQSNGARIAIATKKSRSAVIRAANMVNLAGKNGIVSESSLGVFLQGSLVYGLQGQEIYKANLDKHLCRQAFFYSLEHQVPLVAFCQDQCLTLFEHPLVDLQHTMYHEPKAKIMPSVEALLSISDVQKLLFLGSAEDISTLRSHWLEATRGFEYVSQASADMLEIIPCGASKSNGIKLLLDHLGIAADEIMPHFKGKKKMEMQQLSDQEDESP